MTAVYVLTTRSPPRPSHTTSMDSTPVCVRVEAGRFAAAVGLAQPEWSIMLTQVGETWEEIRVRLNRLRDLVRANGLAWEDMAHIEPNPTGTGNHAHLWQWGDRVPTKILEQLAARARLGYVVGVGRRQRPPGAPLSYGMKAVLAGAPDGADLPPETATFLALNGWRLGHATRRFWRDGPGRPLAGRRAASQVIATRAATGPWLFVPGSAALPDDAGGPLAERPGTASRRGASPSGAAPIPPG